MKIIANRRGALAINPRFTLSFEAGDEFEAGVNGLTDVNIDRLLELKFADLVDVEVVEEVKVPGAYEFESITDKEELAVHAREIYDVELDKKSSLKKMIAALKKTIEGDK